MPTPDDRRPIATPAAWRVTLVTDRAATAGRPLLEVVAAALAAGVGAVQLRERGLPTRELLALAETLRAATAEVGAALLINDRVDVALACGADGVHLPAHGMTVAEARALLGPTRLIGVSTHAPAEVAAAAAAGADFAVFGPLFDTPSKRPYGAPLGVAALAAARSAAPALPLIAIGGIDAGNADQVRAHGADGIAVIRAVLSAGDPGRAVQDLRRGFGA
ncbi:MAG: thiamine phosphate synthase [Deltaproteobacteria bacterium]|nr:thiamine phosphate synthase [Deltaproteobacteria bacterium]